MKTWKRVGLKNNIKVTETLIHRSGNLVKIYLKDFTQYGEYRPRIFHVDSTNMHAVGILCDPWLGYGFDATMLSAGDETAMNFDIYYIMKSAGIIYAIKCLQRTDSMIPEDLQQKTYTLNMKTDNGSKLVGYAFSTNARDFEVRAVTKPAPVKDPELKVQYADIPEAKFKNAKSKTTRFGIAKIAHKINELISSIGKIN